MNNRFLQRRHNMKKVLIPGSFDPITAGHYDLAVRAAQLFDKVYVVGFVNSEKQGFFKPEVRFEAMRAAFSEIDNIICDMSDGTVVDYAAENQIDAIVKGARNGSDFDYELSLSMINRSLLPVIDTLIIPTKPELIHVSSTVVRELIRYGKDFSKYVPKGSVEIIKKHLK